MVISPWRRLRAHMKIDLIEPSQAAFAAGALRCKPIPVR
jgi:hypothetical protein